MILPGQRTRRRDQQTPRCSLGYHWPGNLETEDVENIDPGFTHPRDEHCPQSMYDAQMAYFVDCIRQNRNPIPGGQEGLMNMKVVDAAYESARTGKVIRVQV